MSELLDGVLEHVRQNSLIRISSAYEEVQDRVFVYRGVRPDGRWHGHGFLEVHPRSLFECLLTPITVRKQRWARPDRSATCHSRPPDDLGLHFDGLVVALTLAAVLDAAVGLHHVALPYRTRRPEDAPSVRTIQRWLATAQRHATSLHQALRAAALERLEPRPETLFPRGLSPPRSARQRRWRSPSYVCQLREGFAMVLRAALVLDVPIATLLAEAGARWTPNDP
ncbi:MAG: hypothetical protein AAF211_07895 [Myxococcota bacterium]